MKPKAGLPQTVRLSEWLGGTAFSLNVALLEFAPNCCYWQQRSSCAKSDFCISGLTVTHSLNWVLTELEKATVPFGLPQVGRTGQKPHFWRSGR